MPTYNTGQRRKPNMAYIRVQHEALRRKKAGQQKEAKALRKRQQHLPSHDTTDPDYRRLRYLRYADDILLGFAGPRQEAEERKRQLGDIHREAINQSPSRGRTVTTHPRSQ